MSQIQSFIETRRRKHTIMSSPEFSTIADLKRAVECGQRITPEDVSVIGQIERELSGEAGPMQETAQTLATRQMNFDAKLDELAVKPQSHLTMEDAQEIEEMEVRR
jgi:tRNA pseudouridine-54 N-methylase